MAKKSYAGSYVGVVGPDRIESMEPATIKIRDGWSTPAPPPAPTP
uniref:Uncharacterized protein n=1 Tax=Arundo donax TaxID=35708 RepID=A0A0A9C908_ARUDO